MTGYSGRGLHGQTVQELAVRIVSGRLTEGQTLDVAALEVELDVSRTVLREALRVLAAKGLVAARQKRGTFVRPRSEWNLLDGDVIRWRFAGRTDEAFLDDLHELREMVEPPGARLAAQRRTEADLAAMRGALEQMTLAADDPARQVTADLAFHRALLAAAHNELLAQMEVMIETGLAARDRFVHFAHPEDNPVPAHKAVFDAVAGRNLDRAEQAMRALLDKARKDLESTRAGHAAR